MSCVRAWKALLVTVGVSLVVLGPGRTAAWAAPLFSATSPQEAAKLPRAVARPDVPEVRPRPGVDLPANSQTSSSASSPPVSSLGKKASQFPSLTSRPQGSGLLTAERAVALAMQHSLRLALSREMALQAAADRLTAGSALGLQVAAHGLSTWGDRTMITSTPGGVNPGFAAHLDAGPTREAVLTALVALFSGGRLEAALAGAQASERATLLRAAWETLEVAREARAAFASARLGAERSELARWEECEQEETLRVATAQCKAGKVARYVVLRARAERAAARQALAEARASEQVERARLCTVLGFDPSSSFEIEAPARGSQPPGRGSCAETAPMPLPSDLPPTPSPLAPDLAFNSSLRATVARALRQRPDLLAARAQVQAADQAVRGARARYAPQLFATGSAETMHSGLSTLGHVGGDPTGATPGEGSGRGYNAGLVLSLPLLDAGERRAEVERTRSQQRARQIELDSLEVEVARQILEADAWRQAAAERLRWSTEEVEQATEDLRVARLRFRVGRATHLEVLEATRTLARARYNRVQADYQQAVAEADWLRATGQTEAFPPGSPGSFSRSTLAVPASGPNSRNSP